MKNRTLAVLVVVNLVLAGLLTLTLLTGTEPALAQVDAVGQGGDYVMLAGEPSARREQAVYIVDLRSSQVIGLIFSAPTRKLELIGSRNLSEDVNLGASRQPTGSE